MGDEETSEVPVTTESEADESKCVVSVNLPNFNWDKRNDLIDHIKESLGTAVVDDETGKGSGETIEHWFYMDYKGEQFDQDVLYDQVYKAVTEVVDQVTGSINIAKMTNTFYTF
jgi:hypothetical protein